MWLKRKTQNFLFNIFKCTSLSKWCLGVDKNINWLHSYIYLNDLAWTDWFGLLSLTSVCLFHAAVCLVRRCWGGREFKALCVILRLPLLKMLSSFTLIVEPNAPIKKQKKRRERKVIWELKLFKQIPTFIYSVRWITAATLCQSSGLHSAVILPLSALLWNPESG